MNVRFVVLVHDARKLFCVCTHDVNTKTVMGWKNVASKARAAYERNVGHNITGAIIAMVNTDYQGWVDYFPETVCKKDNDEYIIEKQAIIDDYENMGYTNVGKNLRVSNGPGDGNLPANWNRKFDPTRMTKSKIYDKIAFINLSLQMDIPDSVIHAAYLEIVTNRSTVSYEVDSMLQLLRFVREKTEQNALAA